MNEGTDFSGKTIKLAKNIDLGEHHWAPIGDINNQFKGTFDGQGNDISDIIILIDNPIYNPHITYSGVFGYLGNSGVIKNVNIFNSSTSGETYSTDVYAGGIVGYNDGEILNCSYDGQISLKTFLLSTYLGGIAGYSASVGKVSECKNSGDVVNIFNEKNNSYATLSTGGIVGSNYGLITNCYNSGYISSSYEYNRVSSSNATAYTGGICGNNFGKILIENYTTDNKISSIFCGPTYIGGICGDNPSNSEISINNYINNGMLTANSLLSDAYAGSICGKNSGKLSTIKCTSSSLEINAGVRDGGCNTYIGGMVGFNNDAGTIADCHNSGNVYVTPFNSYVGTYSSLGGIVGYNLGNVTNCYNIGNVETTSNENSFGASIHIGGIIGDNHGNSINCYNAGNLNSTSVSVNLLNICIGGITGYNHNDGKISSCYNTGKIDNSNASIPVNYDKEKLRNIYAGGISGYNYGSISESYNIGAVSSIYTSPDKSLTLNTSHDIIVCTGGITGYNYTGSSEIESCYNTGKICSIAISSLGLDNTQYTSSTLKLSFTAYSGGIVGNNYHGIIKNCYNIGNTIASSRFDSQPQFLIIDMASYAGGISGYCLGEAVDHCYNAGTIESTYTSSVDDKFLNDPTVCGGGIIGDYSRGSGTTPFLYTYYVEGCIENSSNTYGTVLQSDQMNDLYMLGGIDSNVDLNKDQDIPQWSPDLYESNNHLPILSHVPTQVKPQEQESISEPPKSSIYITPSDNTQTDNYLETVVVKHGGDCDLKAHIKEVTGYRIISYQWYKLENNIFVELPNETNSELSLITDESAGKRVAGTYCVRVTYEQNGGIQPVVLSSKSSLVLGAAPLTYTYTSLTITVVELPETQKLITFDSNGGSSIPQQILTTGKYVEEPKNPTRSGYSFLGWYSGDELYNFNTPVSDNIVLTAHWRYNTPYYPSSYSLKLQSNNSSNLYKEYSGSYGTSITLPQIDTLGWEYKDHTFKNWNTKADGSGTSYSAGERFSINSNVTLYAQWEEVSTPPVIQKVTVTFYIGNEVYKVIEVNKDSSLKDKFPVNPESDNGTFKEWNTEEDASGTAFTADSVVSEDTSVYAVWEKSSSSSSHNWWWIIIIIIILIIIIAAYYYYKKNQN